MKHVKVWDPVVRVFHWSLAGAFAANALFVDEDSDLHLWVGYTIVALVAVRIVWGLIGSVHARFSSFPPSISRSVEQLGEVVTGRKTVHLGHAPLGALMIYNLLLSLLVIGATGYMMTTTAFWGMEWTEELHEIAVAWAEFSVLLHIVAVIFESRRTRVNLPRAMVTGYKDIPTD